ncbi:MAG: LptA/OstA family protein [Pseudomonadota bacterium]
MVKMVRATTRAGAAAILVACLTAPVAAAQLSSEGGPIRVNADTSQILERDRRVLVIGNVDIIQGDARLRADRVTLFYGASGAAGAGIGGSFGEIERMRAEGEVFYITPDLKARGDVGTYTAQTDTITLEGDEVVLIRGEDVATGKQLVLNVAQGTSILRGGEAEDDRVSIVIFPEEGGAN